MPSTNLSLAAVMVLAATLFVSALSMLVFPIQPQLLVGSSQGDGMGNPTVSVVLYAGEISAGKYGFGSSPDNLTSPGPTLRFMTSDVINITVVNVGKVPHAFAVVDAPRTGANVLFSAAIASPTNPLSPGQKGTTIFSPNTPNDQYFYECPVPGHPELGMYGSVIVTVG